MSAKNHVEDNKSALVRSMVLLLRVGKAARAVAEKDHWGNDVRLVALKKINVYEEAAKTIKDLLLETSYTKKELTAAVKPLCDEEPPYLEARF